jgi:hypothetical protein
LCGFRGVNRSDDLFLRGENFSQSKSRQNLGFVYRPVSVFYHLVVVAAQRRTDYFFAGIHDHDGFGGTEKV